MAMYHQWDKISVVLFGTKPCTPPEDTVPKALVLQTAPAEVELPESTAASPRWSSGS